MRMTSVAVMIIFLWRVSFRKYMITAMFKVFSQLRGTLTVALERHLTIKDFADIDQHMCRAYTKKSDLLLYASLFLRQT